MLRATEFYFRNTIFPSEMVSGLWDDARRPLPQHGAITEFCVISLNFTMRVGLMFKYSYH